MSGTGHMGEEFILSPNSQGPVTVIAVLLVGKWKRREFKEVISPRLEVWWLVIRARLGIQVYLTPGTAVSPTRQPGF